MGNVPSAKIRNVALVGHGGSGKTSLAEALLFSAGAITRPGRTEDGTTVCDFEPEEHKHSISISLALAPVNFGDMRINIIDTPGYADFVNEVEAALSVADLAIVVVSAVEGVEVQTEVAWRIAERRNLPRMIFVNKLDRERSDFERTLEQLRNLFGAGIAPLSFPIGHETSFHGVADLLTDTAITYDTGKAVTGSIPDEMEEIEHRVHEALVEGIVVADDDLMERYLEGDVPSAEESRPPWPMAWPPGVSSRSSAARRPSRWQSTAWRRSSARSARARSTGHLPRCMQATRRPRSHSTRPGHRSPGCSRRSPTPTSGASRCFTSSRARSGPTRSSSTREPALTRSCTHSRCCGAKSRSLSLRPRPVTSSPCPNSPTCKRATRSRQRTCRSLPRALPRQLRSCR